MKRSSLSALLLIISLTLIPACSLITAIMLAADGVLEDPQTPAKPPKPPRNPDKPHDPDTPGYPGQPHPPGRP